MRPPKTKFLPVVLCVLLIQASFAWSSDRFVADLGELPLMPGLKEDLSMRLVYEKAEGRIVNAVARGRPTVRQIEKFYQETLPQLGWRQLTNREFHREKEILYLTIIRLSSEREVQYKIAPE